MDILINCGRVELYNRANVVDVPYNNVVTEINKRLTFVFNFFFFNFIQILF